MSTNTQNATLPKSAEKKQKEGSRTFCLGDPHGGLRAIEQCFDRSGLNKKKDRLICIGDVADGWPDAAESLEELLTVKNLYYVMGNHDWWLLEYLTWGKTPFIWLSQGGYASLESYIDNPHLKEKHRDFYAEQPFYHILDNILYVHGGFYDMRPIEEDDNYNLMWDRDLWRWADIGAQNYHSAYYRKIFIGHTTTSRVSSEPMQLLNIWNVDQGAGWEGKLTIMDVESEEFWQSDKVSTLYPGVKGRG